MSIFFFTLTYFTAIVIDDKIFESEVLIDKITNEITEADYCIENSFQE